MVDGDMIQECTHPTVPNIKERTEIGVHMCMVVVVMGHRIEALE